MPVPGPRVQERPLPGYRNPEHAEPDLFNLWDRPGPIAMAGRTPGAQWVNLRGQILARGTIRRLWRQAINYWPPGAPFSWTRNTPAPGRPTVQPAGFEITTALRYLTRSVYVGQGIDNSRFMGYHTRIHVRERRSAQSKGRRVTPATGSVRGRPTVRNRLTSFGSRVPTLNDQSPAAEG